MLVPTTEDVYNQSSTLLNVDEEQNLNKHILDFISVALGLWDYFPNLYRVVAF